MAVPLFVSYIRVSTQKQGNSGLGVEAQRAAIAAHLKVTGGQLVAEHVEIESGAKANRPKLRAAIADTLAHKATLVIAKLDRLTRNVAFLETLRDVPFIALDMPGANLMTLQIMTVLAQQEQRLAKERTKAALTALRAQGTKLGKPENLTDMSRQRSIESKRAAARERYRMTAPLALAWRQAGWSLPKIASELNQLRAELARGSNWTPTQVKRVLAYAERDQQGARS